MSGKNDGGASGSGAAKKPIYKKWWFWVIIVFVVLAALSPKNGTTKKAADGGGDSPAAPASELVSSPAPITEASSASDAPAPEPVVDEKSEAQEALKAALSSGSVSFRKTVNEDVTGRWRLLIYSSAEEIVPHAADYYRAFFASDDEVHCVVNLGLKTTTVLTVSSCSLFAAVHEYVDGEEHDAKALAGGMLLASYIVDLSSGEIEEVKE